MSHTKFIFSKRLENVNEYYFSKKLAQIQEMNKQGLDVINLGIGSPDLPPESSVIQKTCEVIQENTSHGYSSYKSLLELRMSISNWVNRYYNIRINPENEILPLLGSKEGILYLSMALLNAGDSVLIPNPGYPAYASVANLLGVNIIYYDLKEENNWLPNLEWIEKTEFHRCKLMWINYPHMPTGALASKDFLLKLHQILIKKNIFLCNDNPYGLILNTEKPLSLLEVDPQLLNSIELNSLSKSLNMAGWRVGFIMGHADVIEAVLKVKSNVDSGMFLPIQYGAIKALALNEIWHSKRNEEYAKRRKIVWEIFEECKFTFSKNQVGLFVWGEISAQCLSSEWMSDAILKKCNVFLTPGFIFGSNGDRYIRASLCASVEKLTNALNRIKKLNDEGHGDKS